MPIIVKLSPGAVDVVEIAQAVEEAGADAISLINTLVGMAIDTRRRKPVLANNTGGLSGPAVKPVAVRMVYQAAQAVGIPIVGLGGIANLNDALEFFMAGASAIQVGTAIFAEPGVLARLIDDSRGLDAGERRDPPGGDRRCREPALPCPHCRLGRLCGGDRPGMKYLYPLLIIAPVVVVLELIGIDNHPLMFVLSALALIPLAAVLGVATETVAEFTGQKIGGLLNATLGNAAELIITIIALREGLILVVKASIVGSIIGNVLVVLGLSLLARRAEERRPEVRSANCLDQCHHDVPRRDRDDDPGRVRDRLGGQSRQRCGYHQSQ